MRKKYHDNKDHQKKGRHHGYKIHKTHERKNEDEDVAQVVYEPERRFSVANDVDVPLSRMFRQGTEMRVAAGVVTRVSDGAEKRVVARVSDTAGKRVDVYRMERI